MPRLALRGRLHCTQRPDSVNSISSNSKPSGFFIVDRIDDEENNSEDVVNEEEEIEEVKENSTEDVGRKTSQRTIKLPQKYDEYEMFMALDATSFIGKVPQNVEDVNGREDEEHWRRAMKREIDSMTKIIFGRN
ncbi:hypothetical protein Trydic_g22551 [Trypoxylus dichotomus]